MKKLLLRTCSKTQFFAKYANEDLYTQIDGVSIGSSSGMDLGKGWTWVPPLLALATNYVQGGVQKLVLV